MNTAQALLDLYSLPNRPPMAMAHAFSAALPEFGSQQAMCSELTRIDPKGKGVATGTIHHYLSLLKLPQSLQDALDSGELRFKAARGLADLPPDRIEQLSTPFVGKKPELSTVYVETYLRLAKRHPEWTVKQLCAVTLNPQMETVAMRRQVEQIAKPKPVVVKPADVYEQAAKLLGLMRACKWDDSADALKARSMLKRVAMEAK